jgi:mersacidin/lichenicidin family type 2 lantibiotic
MNQDQIIRAWKDEDYRSTLSSTELSALPENPAGLVELTEEEFARARGREEITLWLPTLCVALCQLSILYSAFGGGTCHINTAGCCKQVAPPPH